MRIADRAFETTPTQGTGTYTLAGAVSGHRTFLDAIGAGAQTAAICTDGTNWELFLGTLSSGPAQLTRDVILASSNGGNPVNWADSSSKNIFAPPVGALLTALSIGQKGASRPSWARAGTEWTDDTPDPIWLKKIYDGSADIALWRVDTTSNRAVFEEVQATSIASASSIDLGAATGEYVTITGTNGIAALGTVAAGVKRVCRFAGALTLTHHATSLILAGGANITTAAGDVIVFRSEGSGNWRMVGGVRANGKTWVGLAASDVTSGTFASARLPTATTSAPGAVEEAENSEVAAKTDGKFPDAAALPWSPVAAKVWCNYEMIGTASIRQDEGVASLTDHGVGDATVTFDTAFSAATYGVAGAASDSPGDTVSSTSVRNGASGQSVGSVRLLAQTANNATGGAFDRDFNAVACFGTW